MISIIIPTYSKSASALSACLRNVCNQGGEFEVIVSDYGTAELDSIIDDVRCMITECCTVTGVRYDTTDGRIHRSRAMNDGASQAVGNFLLFLHSDTTLPDGGIKKIEQCFDNPEVVAGGFLKRYDRKTPLLALTEFALNVRARRAREFVGTNAIFVRADVFADLRYNENFLEDVEFSDELCRRYGRDRIAVITDPVLVSSEKYLHIGSLKATLINAVIMTAYRRFHIPHHRLETFYRRSAVPSYGEILRDAVTLIKSS